MSSPEVVALLEPAPRSRLGRLLERVDDRMNPILVREVRQGLRGNAFRNLFWLTLALASLICGYGMSMRVIDGDAGGNGRAFFHTMMGLLGLATGYFVPFVAFQSVSSEWEERTRDLLQLSGIGSWAIVRGKLVAALVQAVLFYCAFLPFLAFAFLLRGLDLQQVLVEVNASVANCLVATTVAILLASMGRTRTMRVFLFAALAAGLLMWGGISSAIGALAVGRGGGGVPTLNFETLFAPWLTAIVPVTYGITFARNRFAHEYENQSTPLRVLTTLFSIVILPTAFLLNYVFSPVGGSVSARTVIGLMVGLAFISLLFASEGEQMSRRVSAHVPRGRVRSALAIPWLPGGGRGLIFYSLHAVLLLAVAVLLNLLPFKGVHFDRNDFVGILIAGLFGFILIALPSFLLRSDRSSNNRRILTVLLAGGIPFFGTMVSGFGQLIFGESRSIRPWDLASPPFVIVAALDGRAGVGTLLTLAALALFCLALNGKRILASLSEVSAASAANSQRAQEERRLQTGLASAAVSEERA